MATPGSYRNGTGTQFPPMMTSVDGTYRTGICAKANYHGRVFKEIFATGSVSTYDLDADGAATTLASDGTPLSPLNSVEDPNAVHYAFASALDDQNRTYIVGNSLSSVPHMIRSAPGVINSYTNLPWPFPGFPTSSPGVSSTGGPFCTYNIFNRLSTGELIYHIDQRELSGAPEGKDNLAFYLPLLSDNFVPLIGTSDGEFALSEGTAPTRTYVNGCFVEQYPHRDRVWVWGIGRDDWNDITTQSHPWIIYNDTVTDRLTWKAVDGSSVSMPLQQASVPGSAYEIPQAHGAYSSFQSGQLVVDLSGHPSVILKEGATNNQWHVFYDGASWQAELCATTSAAPSMFRLGMGVAFYREFSNRIQASSILAGGMNVQMGNPVSSAWDIPYADPIQQSKYHAEVHLMIPDGDNPAIASLGNHRPCIAS
jgi:hypothetical protein